MTSMESRAAVAGPTPPWPADRVELWPTETLIPYANNPRLHSAADIERIVASILKWGWTNPVLVDEQGVLIAGHGSGRRRGAADLKSIPGIVAHGCSVEESRPIAWLTMNWRHGGVGTSICCAVSWVISNLVVSISI